MPAVNWLHQIHLMLAQVNFFVACNGIFFGGSRLAGSINLIERFHKTTQRQTANTFGNATGDANVRRMMEGVEGVSATQAGHFA